jgi:hypothetical protein
MNFWWRGPEFDVAVDATGGELEVHGVRLDAVDDRIVSLGKGGGRGREKGEGEGEWSQMNEWEGLG